MQKERTFWQHGHTRVHLDRVEDLGDYVELETACDVIGEDAARAEAQALIAALALDPADFVPLPYRDLLLAQ